MPPLEVPEALERDWLVEGRLTRQAVAGVHMQFGVEADVEGSFIDGLVEEVHPAVHVGNRDHLVDDSAVARAMLEIKGGQLQAEEWGDFGSLLASLRHKQVQLGAIRSDGQLKVDGKVEGERKGDVRRVRLAHTDRKDGDLALVDQHLRYGR